VNAPLLFLLGPLVAGAAAYFLFPFRPRLAGFSSMLLAAAAAWLASIIPLDAPLSFLRLSVSVSGSFSILGREFLFDPSLRSALAFLFIGGAALFGGSLAVPPARLFLPVGWTVLSLFSASLFVQPFLFAAFFLFLSVLALSLLLSDRSHPLPVGAVRWISYSAFGMLFLLLAGTAFGRVDNAPADSQVIETLLLPLCLGFAFLISFPPFHFWLPDVVDDSPPYSVTMILSLYVGAVVFFFLRFMDGFAWLRQTPELFFLLQIGGVSMCLVGALFSVFQDRLGRCFGYLSLCNLGALLLSLSVPAPAGPQITMVLLAARGFSLLVWGVSFHALRPKQSGDRLDDLRGVAASRPLAFSAVLLSGLALVGSPGLISFPALWILLQSVSTGSGAGLPFGVLPFSLILSLLAGVYSMLRFSHPMLQFSVSFPLSVEKSRLLRGFFFVSIALFFLFGFFPQLYIPAVSNAANAFTNLMGIPLNR
jgi:NADH:ubiquinone oxidoreductase subunit 4 (subunit M)